MRSSRLRILAAFCALLAFAVIAVADGVTQFKESQLTAFQHDSEATAVKVEAALSLSGLKLAKSPPASPARSSTAASRKGGQKPSASKAPGPAGDSALSGKTKSYKERTLERIELYTLRASEADAAGDPGLAKLYRASAEKERSKLNVLAIGKPDAEALKNVRNTASKESTAFRMFLQAKDRSALEPAKAAYLADSVVPRLEQSARALDTLLQRSIVPVLLRLTNGPGGGAPRGGCATASAPPPAAAPAMSSADAALLPVLQALRSLVEFFTDDLRYSIRMIKDLGTPQTGGIQHMQRVPGNMPRPKQASPRPAAPKPASRPKPRPTHMHHY